VARDKFDKHYEKMQEKKRERAKLIESDDDAPIPDAPVEQIHADKEPGRNDPCPCGSGKKYKKCCGRGK